METHMADNNISIMGLFESERKAADAIYDLKKSSFRLEKVYSPIPGHHLEKALKLSKSKVGWFTLLGGITGFFSGFLLAIFTASRWDLIVGGKPVVALIPFMIVGFEFTILFAVFGNIVGLITQMKLPTLKRPLAYDPSTTCDRFGILATCPTQNKDQLSDFFKERGGEIKVFEAVTKTLNI
jgi:hypothetical protein